MDDCCNPGNKPTWRKVFNVLLFQYLLEISREEQKYDEVCVSETAIATYLLLVTAPPILKFGTLYLLFTFEFFIAGSSSARGIWVLKNCQIWLNFIICIKLFLFFSRVTFKIPAFASKLMRARTENCATDRAL